MRFQEIYERCWTGYRQAGMKKKGDRQVPNCVPVEEVKIGPEMSMNELLYTAAAKAMRDAGREGIDLDYEDAIKMASKIYGIPYRPSELGKLRDQLRALDARIEPLRQQRELKKQQKRQAKYGTAAAVPDQTQSNLTPAIGRIKPATRTLEETEAELAEDLKKWFKEKWVRFGPDGKIRGACARGSESEGKPKCLPQAKAHALGKKGRASAAAKKRREDPNPERRGPARNVATKVREVKDINAVRDLIKQSGASNAFQQTDNKEQKAMALLDQLKDLNAKNDPLSGYDQKYTKEVKRIVNAILDLGYEVEGPTNGQYTLRTKTWEDNTTVAEGFEYGSRVQHPKYGAGQVIRVYSNGVITVNFPNYPDPIDKKLGIQSNFAPGDSGYQSLKSIAKEQSTNNDDWYDDADEFGMPGSEFFPDEDDRLRDGDYVRDRQDGEYGEIFRMSGDPSERRVRILDRDGKGWYISPERLVAVDRTDPDIMKYFGKRRQRDMDEASVAKKPQPYNDPKWIDKLTPAERSKLAGPNYKKINKEKQKEKVDEKQDACYRKVKSRYKVWPSAYASGALVQCRKKGAANWGTGGKKK